MIEHMQLTLWHNMKGSLVTTVFWIAALGVQILLNVL